MSDNQYVIDVGTNADTASVEDLAAKLQEVEANANSAGNAIGGMDTGQLGAVDNEAKDAAGNLENVNTSANDATLSINNMKSEPLKEVAKSSNEAKNNLSEGAGAAELMTGALTAIIGLGIVNTMYDLADAAGNYNESWERVALLTTGSINNMDAVKDKWNGAISEMQGETGRGAGVIRGHIQAMSIAGVKDSKAIEESFAAIGGASFATGTDIGTLENAFQRSVQTGALSSRTLMALGLSTQDVYTATGLSMDDLKDKFKTMTADQRAAILAQITNTKYGSAANEAYKESWGYVQDQAGLAGDYLKRVVGSVILPILIPAIVTSTGWLKQLGDGFNGLSGPQKTFIGTVIVVGGVLGAVGSAILTLITLKSAFVAITNLSKIAQTEETAATAANTAVTNTGIMSKIRSTIATYSSTAASNTAIGAAMAHAGAIEGVTVAENTGILSRIRSTGATIANTAATGARTIATGAMAAAIWLAEGAQTALNIAMSLNPIGIIIIAIIALVAVLLYLWSTNEGFRAAVIGIWVAISGAFIFAGQTIYNTLLWVWNGIVWFLTMLPQLPLLIGLYLASAALRFILFAATAAQNAMNAGHRIISALQSALGSLGGQMYTWGMNALQSFVNGIINTIPGLRSALDTIAWMFPNSPPKQGPLSRIKEATMYNWMAGIASAGIEGFSSFNLTGINTALPALNTSGYGSASLGFDATEINNNLSATSTGNNQRPVIININQEGIMSQEEAAQTSVNAVKAQLWKENLIKGKSDQS